MISCRFQIWKVNDDKTYFISYLLFLIINKIKKFLCRHSYFLDIIEWLFLTIPSILFLFKNLKLVFFTNILLESKEDASNMGNLIIN